MAAVLQTLPDHRRLAMAGTPVPPSAAVERDGGELAVVWELPERANVPIESGQVISEVSAARQTHAPIHKTVVRVEEATWLALSLRASGPPQLVAANGDVLAGKVAGVWRKKTEKSHFWPF